MPTTYNILILGASYGSLLGTKLALAGHTVNLVCLPAEADLINREGAIVRLPVKGRDRLVEMQSKKLPGKLCAGGTPAFKPAVVQPRPAGVPTAGRTGQRAAGAIAHQFQSGPVRGRRAHRHPAPVGVGH